METERYEFSGQVTESNLKIIYNDNHLISVIKPAGFLSQADGSDLPDMLTVLKKDIAIMGNKPGDAFVALVHRLDTNTRGTMVFGKTSKGASRLSDQIRDKKFFKGYFAVTDGVPQKQSGYLRNFMEKDEKNNKVFESKSGRECILYFKTLCSVNKEGKTYSLVFAVPITGRTHQIRAQLSLFGTPLSGDKKYGGSVQSNGMFNLWSSVCCFKHPTKEVNIFISSIPEGGLFDLFSIKTYTDFVSSLTEETMNKIKNGEYND